MKTRWAALMLPLLLGACASLPGPVAQLERFKDAEANNRPAEIEAERVDADCLKAEGASDACPQIFAIHARACLQLARNEAAPGAACPPATETARRRMDCAATGYGKARAGTGFSTSQREEFVESRARALYCGASYRTPAEGLPMAVDAGAELDGLPPNPRRDQLAAAVALYVANRDLLPADQRCRAARRAADLATRGLASNPAQELAGGLRAAGEGARTVAARINGCGGV